MRNVRPRNGDPRRRYDRERVTESQKLRQVLELLSFSFLCFLPVLRQGFNQGSLIFVSTFLGMLLSLFTVFLKFDFQIHRSSTGMLLP